MASSLDVIKEILDYEMNMPPCRVWAYNQDNDIPKDKNLFIVLHYGKKSPIANNIRYRQSDKGLVEVQSINIVEDVIISLISANNEARDRAWEVHMAMNSTFSRQLQVKNKMHISIIGEVWDASFLESTARLNRFDAKIRVFKSYEKIKSVDYYDKYKIESIVCNPADNIQTYEKEIEPEPSLLDFGFNYGEENKDIEGFSITGNIKKAIFLTKKDI